MGIEAEIAHAAEAGYTIVVRQGVEGANIYSWCADADEKVLQQAFDVASLPFAYHHFALMPDGHLGYGMPIGGVLAAVGAIVPYAVGSDIGCGMRALMVAEGSDTLNRVREKISAIEAKIRELIPMGHCHRIAGSISSEFVSREGLVDNTMLPLGISSSDVSAQIGTLGGGNHFIELQKDIHDNLYVMVHSGSRNIGKRVCDASYARAKNLCDKWHSKISNLHLAFFPEGESDFETYVRDMEFCLRFARANRAAIIHLVVKALGEVLGIADDRLNAFSVTSIDVHHNYAAKEKHYGKEVWVHRKGATSAQADELGIIPGCQGSPSYITKGLGSRESFCSSSHGAGRRMGRREASRTLDYAAELKRLEESGIAHSLKSAADLDEAAGAYKDIGDVMRAQSKLTRIITELTPIAVIKDFSKEAEEEM